MHVILVQHLERIWVAYQIGGELWGSSMITQHWLAENKQSYSRQ